MATTVIHLLQVRASKREREREERERERERKKKFLLPGDKEEFSVTVVAVAKGNRLS